MKYKFRNRNKKGNLLILEFISLIPLFGLITAIVFDFLQLYTVIINMTQATQAAASEIAFMGKDGDEEYVLPTAVKKANAIINYAVHKDADGTAHQTYTYYIKQKLTKEGKVINEYQPAEFVDGIPHDLQIWEGFLVPGQDQYADHRKEIWGFEIHTSFGFNNLSVLSYSYTIDLEAKQYMGILKGIVEG